MVKVTGHDVLNRYSEIRDQFDPKNDSQTRQWLDVLVDHADTLDELDDAQRANLKLFIWDLKNTFRVTLWQRLAREGQKRIGFIRSMHPAVACAIVDAFKVKCGAEGIGMMPVTDANGYPIDD